MGYFYNWVISAFAKTATFPHNIDPFAFFAYCTNCCCLYYYLDQIWLGIICFSMVAKQYHCLVGSVGIKSSIWCTTGQIFFCMICINMFYSHFHNREAQSWCLTCLSICLIFLFNLPKSYDQPSTVLFQFWCMCGTFAQHIQLLFPCLCSLLATMSSIISQYSGYIASLIFNVKSYPETNFSTI